MGKGRPQDMLAGYARHISISLGFNQMEARRIIRTEKEGTAYKAPAPSLTGNWIVLVSRSVIVQQW